MIQWLWQLPQHLLALILIKIVGAKKTKTHGGASVYMTHHVFGISLGEYIIVWDESNDVVIRHEYGHTLQSRMLGPAYLIIVGLPSITMNLLSRAGILRVDRYYDRWPEDWADRLGGVTIKDGRRQ